MASVRTQGAPPDERRSTLRKVHMALLPNSPKIYHIVNVDKLPSIISDGRLFCDSTMAQRAPAGTTIGMGSIKQRRLALPVKCYSGAVVGDFVPFYYCPRSVMLYVIHRASNPELGYKGGQDPIVHLEADLNTVLAWAANVNNSWAASDSNAGAAYAQFSNSPAHFSTLNWGYIAATSWSQADIKEAKQAEFLMYRSFPWHLVERVGTKTLATYNLVSNALALATHKPPVQIITNWYY